MTDEWIDSEIEVPSTDGIYHVRKKKNHNFSSYAFYDGSGFIVPFTDYTDENLAYIASPLEWLKEKHEKRYGKLSDYNADGVRICVRQADHPPSITSTTYPKLELCLEPQAKEKWSPDGEQPTQSVCF